MSGNEDELEDLRRQRLEELQEQAGGEGGAQEAAQEAAREQAEAQRKAVLRQYLTDEARQRLNTVKMSKPEFGDRVEQQVVALARSGRLQGRIDDAQMKELLSELTPDSGGYNIKRR